MKKERELEMLTANLRADTSDLTKKLGPILLIFVKKEDAYLRCYVLEMLHT